MIRYVEGNLLESDCEAFVNACNTVGVLGAGVAKLFRDDPRFGDYVRFYVQYCRSTPGLTAGWCAGWPTRLERPRLIYSAFTKDHWKYPSRLPWVRGALTSLKELIELDKVASVAMPALGCGKGGLRWEEVQNEIELTFGDSPNLDVHVYLPHDPYPR